MVPGPFMAENNTCNCNVNIYYEYVVSLLVYVESVKSNKDQRIFIKKLQGYEFHISK